MQSPETLSQPARNESGGCGDGGPLNPPVSLSWTWPVTVRHHQRLEKQRQASRHPTAMPSFSRNHDPVGRSRLTAHAVVTVVAVVATRWPYPSGRRVRRGDRSAISSRRTSEGKVMNRTEPAVGSALACQASGRRSPSPDRSEQSVELQGREAELYSARLPRSYGIPLVAPDGTRRSFWQEGAFATGTVVMWHNLAHLGWLWGEEMRGDANSTVTVCLCGHLGPFSPQVPIDGAGTS
jgi:hypothetical protein